MKLLNGKEIAEFIKARQLRQVRALRQANHIIPKLAIVNTTDNPVIETYMRLKKQYGDDVLVDVEIFNVEQSTILEVIDTLNNNSEVYGIIIQLPLADDSQTDEVVARIAPEKDVDGMSGRSNELDPATAMAINWLLASYNVDLRGKKIAIVGRGRLVGAPLEKMWRNSGLDIEVFEKGDGKNLETELINYDVIVTATGVPGLITDKMVKHDAVVVDAGTASEGGVIVGDVAAEVRERQDITITPIKGGVGPLTVAALFDNVITAAQKAVSSDN
jgi:methylenetetrahydrofolate dehydrogenase (NADP+) / methenyltetrahydrofolate cyclohydrolase